MQMLELILLQYTLRQLINLKNSIHHIKKLNKKVGVSLNPETKIDLVTDIAK